VLTTEYEQERRAASLSAIGTLADEVLRVLGRAAPGRISEQGRLVISRADAVLQAVSRTAPRTYSEARARRANAVVQGFEALRDVSLPAKSIPPDFRDLRDSLSSVANGSATDEQRTTIQGFFQTLSLATLEAVDMLMRAGGRTGERIEHP
jgi:hypothetical protein